MIRHPHIVFDLDGTLVDSLPGISQAINLALISLNLPTHPPTAIRAMIGRGARELCAKALGAQHSNDADADLLHRMEQAFAHAYAQTLAGDGTRVFPGVLSMISNLSANGAHLAILSNKPQEPTTRIVKALFHAQPFTHVFGFEKGRFERKPSPETLHFIAREWGVDIADIILVGDSIHDAKTAENAGCQLALVAWGYSSMEPLLTWREQHPCQLLGTIEDLNRFLLK